MTNAHGMDISLWNDQNSTAQTVDFAKARAAGMTFAYIKASQAGFADPDYVTNWRNAKGKVYRGGYHFLTWNDPIAQARFFWGLLRADPGEITPMVDFEWWQTVPAGALVYLRAFVDEFYALSGIRCGIYTAKSFWQQYGTLDTWWAQYPLWLCDIAGAVEVPAPWTAWTFHQYTFKLNGPTYGAESLDLDGDWYNGSEADMMARYNLAPLGQPETEKWIGIPLTVKLAGINIRTVPTTVGNDPIGSLIVGERIAVTEMRETDGYQWGRHARGWSVIDTGNWWIEP